MSFMKRFALWNEQRGAITVYASIVLVPIMLLQGMLLDYIRVKYTQISMEHMTRAMSRSVLSAFDRQLREYGLFGLQASENEQMQIVSSLLAHYSGVETGSMLVSGRSASNVQITPLYTLADHAVLHRQIDEEMKLHAPLAFTAYAFNMWTGKSAWLQGEQDRLRQAERIERLLQERGRALEHAGVCASEFYAELQRIYAAAMQQADAEEGHADVLETQHGASRSDASSLERTADQLRSALSVLRSAEEGLEQALLAYTSDGPLPEAEVAFTLLLDENGVQTYEQQVDRLLAQYSSFAAAAYGLADAAELRQMHAAHMSEAQDWLRRIQTEASSRQAKLARLNLVKDNSRRELAQSLSQVARAVDQQLCSADADYEAAYERLPGLEHAYRSYNEADAGYQAYPAAALTQTPEEYQRQSLAVINRISELTESIKDEVYVNEYALRYFSHRLAPRAERTISSGEVEYIMYGMASCADNRGSAYADIFMMRFGIRMAETLIQARTAVVAAGGSPLALFLHAAAQGAVTAAADMERLLHGERIEWFDGSGDMRSGYEDYLRLLLALHTRPVDMLPRLQALIELQTGTNLSERPAHVEVRLRSGVELWFLPGAARLLQPGQHIAGRTWLVDKRAVMSY